MRRRWAVILAMAGVLGSCSHGDEQRARARAAAARRKAREGAPELAYEARRAANALSSEVKQALNGPPGRGEGEGARQKLRNGTDEAGTKLDQAALLAKVKAKLANDVGLSTVTGVDVEVTGNVVTLRGTVSSPEQKQLAERAAGQVAGVGRVIDELQVK
jgi:osmotically-inducible protein OsmY